ncbi:hypothetical protein CR513_01390, partial [Mucuna pruriens]
MTARMKIDIHVEILLMEFGNTFVKFNIFEALKHPTEDHSIFNIDAIERLVDEYAQISTNHANLSYSKGKAKAETNSNMQELIETKLINPNGNANSDSSQEESQQTETESDSGHSSPLSNRVGQPNPSTQEKYQLPEHLKYAYLRDNQKFPVIIRTRREIARSTQEAQESNRLDTSRPSKDQPLHLHAQNSIGGGYPIDVVKNEVTKLLAVGIIYPISDNQWVSPVQVVPKKSGMTVIKNRQGEMVPARIQNSWRVCIDYKKQNQATRKDHFSLPFVDQVLEKLVGYMQIHITPMNQHKTTFTCPFGMFAYTRMLFGLYKALSTF